MVRRNVNLLTLYPGSSGGPAVPQVAYRFNPRVFFAHEQDGFVRTHHHIADHPAPSQGKKLERISQRKKKTWRN